VSMNPINIQSTSAIHSLFYLSQQYEVLYVVTNLMCLNIRDMLSSATSICCSNHVCMVILCLLILDLKISSDVFQLSESHSLQ
jgi:hypothetical protein